ncbi:transposable element Tc1 transposase [Trichonephila clavipes]|nr:transposable element Tc1 transposase [Trichonephila clavipes]
MTIHRRLMERNLRSYQLLRNLPLTPTHCRHRLQWCLARSGWNHADWGRIVLSDEFRFQLCPDDRRSRVRRRPGQRTEPFTVPRPIGPQPRVMIWVPRAYFSEDKARPHTARVAMNCLKACQTVLWPSRSPDLSTIQPVWDMMGRRLHLPGNEDYLTR